MPDHHTHPDPAVRQRIAEARAEGAREALLEAAEALSARLDTFPQQGRHTRARWAEWFLRDRAEQIGGDQ